MLILELQCAVITNSWITAPQFSAVPSQIKLQLINIYKYIMDDFYFQQCYLSLFVIISKLEWNKIMKALIWIVCAWVIQWPPVTSDQHTALLVKVVYILFHVKNIPAAWPSGLLGAGFEIWRSMVQILHPTAIWISSQ